MNLGDAPVTPAGLIATGALGAGKIPTETLIGADQLPRPVTVHAWTFHRTDSFVVIVCSMVQSEELTHPSTAGVYQESVAGAPSMLMDSRYKAAFGTAVHLKAAACA